MNQKIDTNQLGRIVTRAIAAIAVMSLFFTNVSAFAAEEPQKPTVTQKAPAAETAPAPYSYGDRPAQEKVPGGSLMLFAYFFIWLIPLLLLFKATKEAARLEERLTQMEQLVREATESKS